MQTTKADINLNCTIKADNFTFIPCNGLLDYNPEIEYDTILESLSTFESTFIQTFEGFPLDESLLTKLIDGIFIVRENEAFINEFNENLILANKILDNFCDNCPHVDDGRVSIEKLELVKKFCHAYFSVILKQKLKKLSKFLSYDVFEVQYFASIDFTTG